jgi:TonB family protein
MSTSTPEFTTELLFNWDSPRGRKTAIAAFLSLSVIAHALCFYIFQVVYPPTVALLPPPARVSLITPDSEEGRTLLRWIDAEDPALAFTTQPPPEAKLRALPKVNHLPSYVAAEPALKEVPSLDVDLRIPSSQPPGPVSFIHRQAPPVVGPTTTAVSFSKELDAFCAPALPNPTFAASNAASPETVRFRVAVSETGEIRYCFLLRSSGDPALDEQARRYLALCRFSRKPTNAEKIDSSLTWGVATIEWGSDVARPRPKPAETATP